MALHLAVSIKYWLAAYWDGFVIYLRGCKQALQYIGNRARNSSFPAQLQLTEGHMKILRIFDKSFVHGVITYSAYSLGPFLESRLCAIVAFLFCVYAGWSIRSYLPSFLGGVIVAVVIWTAAGALEVGFGVFFMVPFALLVILPTALAGYMIGKIIFMITRRADGTADAPPKR